MSATEHSAHNIHRNRWSGSGLPLASAIAAFCVLSAIAISLWEYRQEVEARALLTGHATVAGVQAQLSNEFDRYDGTLRLVSASFTDPMLQKLDDDTWRFILRNLLNSGSGIRSITIADSNGRVHLHQGASFASNLAPLPFFRTHQASEGLGLLISEPIAPEEGIQTIVFSRRMTLSDGKFGGIVALVVDLASIQNLLTAIPISPTDSITIVSDDGRVIARKPWIDDDGGTDLDLWRSSAFQALRLQGQGSFVSTSSLDDTERLFTFGKVGGTKLIVAAGLATEALYGNWRRLSVVIGGLALAISVALVAAARLLARESRLRAAAQEELEKQASTDFLTGLANRREFEASLAREWRRSARTGAALAVILFDADHFKMLNDQQGHAVGDEMLKLIATVLGRCARRPGDLSARIGGEEFAMLLADTTAAGAAKVAELVRSQLREAAIQDVKAVAPVTLSAGVAATRGRSFSSAAALLADADAALYRAKAEGRDRVSIGVASAAEA